MKVNGKHYLTIWLKDENPEIICIIDQRHLPHQFVIEELQSVKDIEVAIRDMHVRGAGLIGAAAAYGMYIATIEASRNNSAEEHLTLSAHMLKSSRPTAVNLEWAVNRQLAAISTGKTPRDKIKIAKEVAKRIASEDAENCRSIGLNGARIIEQMSKKKKGSAVNILTHCNAGWLAFVDHGSALAPVYESFDKGINVHVWVSETRPRNQGAALTAWELNSHGVPHTVVVDNAAGHLMQHGKVDVVITGADRVTRAGDAANKVGTYLKALAARDNNIPFYVALPSSTFDWDIQDGIKEITIEERTGDEVKYMSGLCGDEIKKVLVTSSGSEALNYGFDVTPARLITSLITERGICRATEEDIVNMFPEKFERV